MPGRWVRVFSALALVLACAAQPLPAVIDTHKVDPAVRITAEQKAKELCGWGAEAIAHVQEDVAKNATSAPARRLLELGKGSPKVVKGAKPAATPAVTTDPAELARILCAELDVAKKLDAVGDRLELELEATLELEESQEAKRAKAKQREEVAAEKLSKEETALGILLIVGGLVGGIAYVIKTQQAEASGTAPAAATDAAQNEDLKKRLNKLRAATATRT